MDENGRNRTLTFLLVSMIETQLNSLRVSLDNQDEVKESQEAHERFIGALLTLKFEPERPDQSVYNAVTARDDIPAAHPLRLLHSSSNVHGSESSTSDSAANNIVILSLL